MLNVLKNTYNSSELTTSAIGYNYSQQCAYGMFPELRRDGNASNGAPVSLASKSKITVGGLSVACLFLAQLALSGIA